MSSAGGGGGALSLLSENALIGLGLLLAVLTAIAHKYSLTTLVPSLSYLTFLDKYVLVSLFLIVLITGQGGLIGGMMLGVARSREPPPAPGDSSASSRSPGMAAA